MNAKEKLIKLREKVRDVFTSESAAELETMTKKKDPLESAAELGSNIARTIVHTKELEEENRLLRERLGENSKKILVW